MPSLTHDRLANSSHAFPRPAETHPQTGRADDMMIEIGHEKAQSVIDSITSSYAAEGQAHANPMLPQNQPGQGFPPFPFPGGKLATPSSSCS
jgi:hypothetical protein